MKICVLGSGSRGNCTLVETGDTSLLIDAGFSGKDIQGRLERIGRSLESVTAVLLTHEHNDHISGAGILSRKARIPLYANAGTYRAAEGKLGKPHEWGEFGTGEQFAIDGLQIHPFKIYHDTADPVGFVISDGVYAFGYCTDTGKVTKLMERRLKECDALILESNHDPKMLREGPYPPHLQQRVRSSHGHLANEDAGNFLSSIVSERLKHVVLAHLSETNNLPGLALQTVVSCLDSGASRTRIIVAAQSSPAPVIDLAE